MLTIFYISIFFLCFGVLVDILSFRFLGHPKNWESLRMAVVLHLCSNKPASRAQTGSNRVVVVMRADARVPPPDLLRVSSPSCCEYLQALEALRDEGTFDVVH